MKKLLIALLCLAVLPCWAQKQTTNDQIITASGSSVQFFNGVSGTKISVEEDIIGRPSAMSIVVAGCDAADSCTTLNTSTATTSTVVGPLSTGATVYDHFKITATWTGSGVSVEAKSTVTGAQQTYPTPGGSVTPAGSSGDVQTNNGSGGLGSVAPSTTVNSQTCALGASCTVTAAPTWPLTSSTASPAQTGQIRLSNNEESCWRNAADGADICVKLDSGNAFAFASNITTTGTITAGTGSSTAGGFDCGQGTDGGAPAANHLLIQCPTSVTAYRVTLPGAAATGPRWWSNAAGVVTESVVDASGNDATKFLNQQGAFAVPSGATPANGAVIGATANGTLGALAVFQLNVAVCYGVQNWTTVSASHIYGILNTADNSAATYSYGFVDVTGATIARTAPVAGSTYGTTTGSMLKLGDIVGAPVTLPAGKLWFCYTSDNATTLKLAGNNSSSYVNWSNGTTVTLGATSGGVLGTQTAPTGNANKPASGLTPILAVD